MSHFSVAVFMKDTDNLEALLQPFHEFECTGHDDEYVKTIDITEECMENYNSYTFSVYKDTNGNFHDKYDDVFYREPTDEEIAILGDTFGSGFNKGISYKTALDANDNKITLVHFKPDNMEEVEVNAKDIKSFEEFIQYYHGCKSYDDGDNKYGYYVHTEDGVRVFKRTNPNAKWDWWCVGGRYSGKFSSNDPYLDPDNMQECYCCGGSGMRNDELGKKQRETDPNYTCNGCGGTGTMLKSPSKWKDEGNTIIRRDADITSMKNSAMDYRRRWIDDIIKETNLSEREIEECVPIAPETRNEYQNIPLSHRPDFFEWLASKGRIYDNLSKVYKHCILNMPDIKKGQTIQEWIESAPAFTAFAIIKDGQWIESGSMGWWGMVSDAKDQDAWDEFVWKTFVECDPDTVITIVDCHI